MYPILSLFGFSFGTYGICCVIGGALAIWLAIRNGKRFQQDRFAMLEAETLTALAVEELRLCKRTHDAIETIYRPFVDYDHVERETNRLLETLKL